MSQNKTELLVKYLAEKGLHLEARHGWVKVSCINTAGHARGDMNPSASVNLNLGRYRCFACGIGGDVYDIMEALDGTTFKEARQGMPQPKEESVWI